MRLTARKPTEAELAEAMENKPVYKVVKVKPSGELKSLLIIGTRKYPEHIDSRLAFALTYKRGMLSSNGKFGVWCCKTMKDAIHQVDGNGRGNLCYVFLAHPIGNPIPLPRRWEIAGTVLYPSIILGKEIVKVIDNRLGRFR